MGHKPFALGQSLGASTRHDDVADFIRDMKPGRRWAVKRPGGVLSCMDTSLGLSIQNRAYARSHLMSILPSALGLTGMHRLNTIRCRFPSDTVVPGLVL